MTDAADRAGPDFVVGVEPGDHCRRVVGDQGVRDAVHGGPDHPGHRIVTPGNIEMDCSQSVIHVRQQAEISLLGDPPRHVAQFLPCARRVHVENDRWKGPGPIRTRRERGHPAMLRRNCHVLFVHLSQPLWSTPKFITVMLLPRICKPLARDGKAHHHKDVQE
jgi:hypothetical protein